ncbi:oxidoreductase [Noviherbaspirillum cavernae]|uniref:Oxidoreductase n=1 Tax=Noviherbaspirillum cavernae TaxID=2320862 RepID=A0A418WUU3_9BURK|nr:PDR/VanB family oxidoreductase [Noviherbaspirillum cavernae]RJF96474.1 oxidoreductase [Noviherbaspirillum cavernae]
MNQLSVRVLKKTREAEDIVSFELASADGRPLPPFSAGSHLDVRIPGGIVRQYSLCNDPAESHRYLIAVLRDAKSRGGSIAMHERVNEGDVIEVSEPKNHFPLVPAERVLLLAGGIGVTPILCMAERLAHTATDFAMHYCTRSSERTAFRSRIARSRFADKVHYHFDTDAPEQKLDFRALFAAAEHGTHLYVCGPGGFIEHVRNTARDCGWPSERIHLEYFGAQAQDNSRDDSFEIKLASSGTTYRIPAGKTVVEVLAEHDIEIPTSCEQGVCGTCITRVIEGTPDHRDVYLTDDERARNDQFTPCCSRARSATLVLDL